MRCQSRVEDVVCLARVPLLLQQRDFQLRNSKRLPNASSPIGYSDLCFQSERQAKIFLRGLEIGGLSR